MLKRRKEISARRSFEMLEMDFLRKKEGTLDGWKEKGLKLIDFRPQSTLDT